MQGFIELITPDGEEFSPRIKDIQAIGSRDDENGYEQSFIVYHNKVIYIDEAYWDIRKSLKQAGASIICKAHLSKDDLDSFMKQFSGTESGH